MLKLVDGIVELYKKVAVSIPPDVEAALVKSLDMEREGDNAHKTLKIIIENIKTARKDKRPVCQDTGIPYFWVRLPEGLIQRDIREIILEATEIAMKKVPLRANSLDIVSDYGSVSTIDKGFPVITFSEHDQQTLVVDLMLKGAGCENAGRMYTLPDIGLNAERDFSGVRRCVADAVIQTQGKACPPYTLGVAIGSSRDLVTALSKKLLLRRLGTRSESPTLAGLEESILADINSLNIGPGGIGGATTALSVMAAAQSRHPASYFVDVSFSCWANRRGRLIWS